MNIIDLSHAIHDAIPVYPGTEPPSIEAANSIAEDGFAELRLSMYSHTATHIDAPCHIVAGGKSLDQFPAGHFIGPAVLIDLRNSPQAEIRREQLESYAKQLEKAAFALLHTGWSTHWGKECYFNQFPHLSREAAEWLSRFALRGVGIDTISIDHIDRADLPAHHILLEAGMIIIENLTNLATVSKAEFTFSCLPLPISSADGSPVRAVAIEN